MSKVDIDRIAKKMSEHYDKHGIFGRVVIDSIVVSVVGNEKFVRMPNESLNTEIDKRAAEFVGNFNHSIKPYNERIKNIETRFNIDNEQSK